MTKCKIKIYKLILTSKIIYSQIIGEKVFLIINKLRMFLLLPFFAVILFVRRVWSSKGTVGETKKMTQGRVGCPLQISKFPSLNK